MGDNLTLALFCLLPAVCGAGLWRLACRLRRPGTVTRWTHLLYGNLLLAGLLLGLLLVGAEVYYRFIFDTTDSLMFTKVSQRWQERYWQKNRAGVRDNVEYAMPIEPGKRRVTFFGDSFTAGQGIKDVENRFVNRFRAAHGNLEVHMLAMPGYDTGDELDLLVSSLHKGYQLDEVVLVYCLNDVSDMMPERTRAVDAIDADLHQSGWFRRHSYFINILFHRLKARRNAFMRDYFSFVRDAYRGPLWEKQQARLKAFKSVVEANKGHLCVITFPFLNALGPYYEYRFAHDELDAFWRSLTVPNLDLLSLYSNLPPARLTVNHFDAHPNEYAHALAFPVIDKFIEEDLAAHPAVKR